VRFRSLLLVVVLGTFGCSESRPPPGPPGGGGPRGGAGGSDGGSTDGTADAPPPSGCETVGAGDAVTLTALGGDTPAFEPMNAIARWVCGGSDAQLQVALTTSGCNPSVGDRLVVATDASAIDDALVFPGAVLGLGTSPYVVVLLSVDGNVWPTCLESGGTVTFEQVTTSAGSVRVTFDATVTDCVDGTLPPIAINGSFDAVLETSRAEACP
jgi:hypothetical protein